MKVTLKQIQAGTNAINSLLVSRLPVKAAYRVSKLASAMEAEQRHYDAAREKVFKDAGCEIKEGNWVHDDPAVLETATKQIEELLGEEVELNFLPLDIEQFGDASVPGNAFAGLGWAMKED